MKKRLPIILAYLLVVTFAVTGASFARFRTTGSVSDSATVAKVAFDYVPMSATLNGEPIFTIDGGISVGNVQPGSVLIYTFQVRNYQGANLSQVLLKYSISVSFDPSARVIPLTYSLTPNDTYPSNGSGWYYMTPGSQKTQSFTLTVLWASSDSQETLTGQSQSVRIKVDAQQADGMY